METTLNNQQQPQDIEKIVEIEGEESINIYPAIRHLFLTFCILLAISIIIFLIYQNGKSIYDKGL